jgi:hypothetical protein
VIDGVDFVCDIDLEDDIALVSRKQGEFLCESTVDNSIRERHTSAVASRLSRIVDSNRLEAKPQEFSSFVKVLLLDVLEKSSLLGRRQALLRIAVR